MSSSSSLQRHSSMTLAGALSGKRVDDVWREIQQGQQKQYGDDMKIEDREITYGKITLEDFFVEVGICVEHSAIPTMKLNTTDSSIPQSLQQITGLSPSPSVSSLSDTKLGRKRDAPDAYEKALERRMGRKIMNSG
ncbi:hypothetical protein TanjilG_00237 [Lupinus angustifolius]|uniref:Uncharacterized protein n=1 Tax=Lupinus angustifolius TaxID=3871 RepID=A0A1J7GNH2_LUPAN|nr:PREDICTED: uncharacterized protein LOC109359714 [Lupinus angustifolius]OIW01998.1 hypothetical protein TanjilG_00237 [Lupinus angustifolius]